jgi:beta-lactamase class A
MPHVPTSPQPRRRWFTSPLVCFFGGALLTGAFFLLFSDTRPRLIGGATEIREGGYQFINPLLECEQAGGLIDATKVNFQSRVTSEIEKLSKKGTLQNVSVYYRDLNNGPWFGIREEIPFTPASLLKVPVSMAFFKMSESDPGILERKVKFEKPFEYLQAGNKQLIPPKVEIEVGKEYTVLELIEAALEHSDNQAVSLLYANVDTNELISLYRRLGVPDDVLFDAGATLSVKNYAAFFRILYNASYLSREHSEQMLQYLSVADFTDGIVAGVPATTPVSHKFGESGTFEEHQLHDCGIVYHPTKPYLLCIMTEGTSLDNSKAALSDISRVVYEDVSSQ